MKIIYYNAFFKKMFRKNETGFVAHVANRLANIHMINDTKSTRHRALGVVCIRKIRRYM